MTIDPLMVVRWFCYLFLDNYVQDIISEGVLSRLFFSFLGKTLERREKKAPGLPARLNFSKFYKLGDRGGDLSRISAGKLWEFLSLLTSVQAYI
jgi:hypothetical protein